MLFRPVRTGMIADKVYAVNAVIGNSYIFDTDEGLVAFDTGLNPPMLAAGMKKLGLVPADVSHVFLTHSDYDHVGGLPLFKDAVVYLSKREEPMVTGEKARLLFRHNKRLYNYTALEDREIVTVGSCNVQLIEAPGHTVGSACYLVNGDILVSGDALRTSGSGRITPFLIFQNMNHAEDKGSVERLHSEGIIDRAKMILTGHTGVLLK